MNLTDIKAPSSVSGGLLDQVAGSGARAGGQPFEQVLGQQMGLSTPQPAKEGLPAVASPGNASTMPLEAASTPADLLALLNQARTTSGPSLGPPGAILESGVTTQATESAIPGQLEPRAIAGDMSPPAVQTAVVPPAPLAAQAPQGPGPALLGEPSTPPGQQDVPSARNDQSSQPTQLVRSPLAAAGDQVRVATVAGDTRYSKATGTLAGTSSQPGEQPATAVEATGTPAQAASQGLEQDARDEAEFSLIPASPDSWPFAPLQAQTAVPSGPVPDKTGDGLSNARASQANAVDTPDPADLSASAARALAGRALREDAGATAAGPAPDTPADSRPWLARQTDGAAEVGRSTAAEDGVQPAPAGGPAQPTHASPAGQTERVQAEAHVQTPLRQSGWDQAVSQRVLWMAQDQLQSASLTLNPPHLGPVQVTLQLDAQQASVQFVSPHAEVRQALQDALPVLRELLGQAGIQLGQADVGSRQSRQGEQTFQKPARGSSETAEQDVAAAPEIGAGNRRGGRGLVDLLA